MNYHQILYYITSVWLCAEVDDCVTCDVADNWTNASWNPASHFMPRPLLAITVGLVNWTWNVMLCNHLDTHYCCPGQPCQLCELSICLSHACVLTKQKPTASILILYEDLFLYLSDPAMVVGGHSYQLILWPKFTHPIKLYANFNNFLPVSNRYY